MNTYDDDLDEFFATVNPLLRPVCWILGHTKGKWDCDISGAWSYRPLGVFRSIWYCGRCGARHLRRKPHLSQNK